MNETEHKNWELVVDDVWDNEQRMTPEKRDAILAADDRLQALEAAVAGHNPDDRMPDFGQVAVVNFEGEESCVTAFRQGCAENWIWIGVADGEVIPIDACWWWPLPGAALDGEAVTKAVD